MDGFFWYAIVTYVLGGMAVAFYVWRAARNIKRILSEPTERDVGGYACDYEDCPFTFKKADEVRRHIHSYHD